MIEAHPRLSGVLFLAGAGIVSLVCQALDANTGHQAAHAIGLALGVLMVLLASTGAALLIHGAGPHDRYRQLRAQKGTARKQDVIALVTAPITSAGHRYDTIDGATLMQARHARRRFLKYRL